MDWDQYFANSAPGDYATHFHKVLVGAMGEIADRIYENFGFSFDVRNLAAEGWFSEYELTFAQPAMETTKADVQAIIVQAEAEGYGIDQISKQLGLTFDKYMDPNFTLDGHYLSQQERKWFEDRAPRYRRDLIARTETIRASNAGSYEIYNAWDVVDHKEWLSTNDDRTRDSHVLAGSMYSEGGVPGPIPMDQPFIVGGAQMQYPGDPSAPVGEFANCRCTIAPVVSIPEEGERLVPLEQAPIEQPPAEAPAPLPQEGDWPEGLAGLETVSNLGGSTGALLVRDPVTGAQYVLKRGNSPDHIRSEYMANLAYKAAGVDVPDVRLYSDETTGDPVQLSRFIENAVTLKEYARTASASDLRKVRKALQKGLAADALMANWDVIGLDADNILVDEDGTPWRIDNGGSFKYRAQGDTKGDRFNEWVTELWTMRDPKINSTAASWFDDVPWTTIHTQARRLSMGKDRAAILDAVSGNAELARTMEGRLDSLKQVYKVGKEMRLDDWTYEYTDQFVGHTQFLQEREIDAYLPEELKPTRQDDIYKLRDPRTGEPFDGFRNGGRARMTIEDYLTSIGGNSRIIQSWARGQGGSSWDYAPVAQKYRVYQNRNKPYDAYYWNKSESETRGIYEHEVNNFGGAEIYEKTWAAWHAYTYMSLQQVDFPGNNRRSNYVKLARTEPSHIMSRYGLRPGQDNVTMLRGASESSSPISTVIVAGNQLTLQKVPHTRIIATYFTSQNPLSGHTMFYGDHENEFIFIPEGIEFTYYGTVGKGEDIQANWKQWGGP